MSPKIPYTEKETSKFLIALAVLELKAGPIPRKTSAYIAGGGSMETVNELTADMD